MPDDKFFRLTNERNGIRAYVVDAQSFESSFSEEFTGNTDNSEEIITPLLNDTRIVIHDILLVTDGNQGIVSLDIGEKKIARLYASQFNRFNASEMTIQGEFEEPVELKITGAGSGQKTFVMANFTEIKESLEVND